MCFKMLFRGTTMCKLVSRWPQYNANLKMGKFNAQTWRQCSTQPPPVGGKKSIRLVLNSSLFIAASSLSTAGLGIYCLSKSNWTVLCKTNTIEEKKSITKDLVAKDKYPSVGDTNNDISLSTNGSSLWVTLIRYIQPDLVWLLISIPSAILAAYYNIQINLVLGDLMNAIQSSLQSSSISSNEHFLANFIALIKTPATNLLSTYLCQTANRLRCDLFAKFLSLELSFYDLNNGGNMISALSNDVQEFKSSFKQVISLGIKNVTQIMGCLLTLYRISPEMTLTINVVIIPTMALIGSQVGIWLRSLSRKLQIQLGKITDVAFESINNIRTVKILAIEDILCRKFLQEVAIFDALNRKFSAGFALFQSLSNLALNAIVLSTMLFGGHQLLGGQITAGNLMSFLATTQTIQRSLFQLSLLYGHCIKMTSSLQRMAEYLAISSPQISGAIIPNFIGNIEFKNVIFKYPKRPEYEVLKKINLKLEPGKVTALCGSSGSGKSTIAMLLENLYDIQSGSILVDQVELTDLNREWLRKDIIGYISQEPILFCASIRDNIKFGKSNATEEELIYAAKLANAHDFIMSFPDDYDTIVGHQGTALSGGQRQRIAIARAIIKDPKILVLDEATSALDSESEALVKDALNNVMHNRTVLVIAHRLSTIVNSDQIIVLNNGTILELGTHQQLLEQKGKYYDLVRKNIDTNVDILEN